MSKLERPLTPGEVAALFRVDPRTVGRWANAKRISSFKTPGGHRRYPANDIKEFIKSSFTESTRAAKLRQLANMIGGESAT